MKSRLTPIYAVQTLTGLAGSLVGFFIPVYLLTLGYQVRDIMWLLLVQAAVVLVFSLATGWLSAKIQIKYLMAARVPVILVLLGVLINFKAHPLPLAVIGILEAAHFALYYIPLHVLFTEATAKDQIGRQFGVFLALPKLISIIGPIAAGVVASTLGFNYVFIAAAVLYVLSSFPMLAIEPYREELDFSWAKFRLLYHKYRRYFWLEVAENIQEELDLIVWPLVVFLSLHSTIGVGAVGTVVSAGSALFTYLIGRASDRHDKFRMLRLGAVLSLMLWLVRLGTITPPVAFGVSALVGLTSAIQDIPFNSIIYNLARDNNPREFIMFREVPIAIARVTVYGAGVALAAHVQWMFWFAILAYAVFAFMSRFKLAD